METLATISIAMFEGLAMGRLIDPDAFSQQTLTEALTFLYLTIGVKDEPPPDRSRSGVNIIHDAA